MKGLSHELAESYRGPKVSYQNSDEDSYDYEDVEKDFYRDLRTLNSFVVKMFKEEIKKFGRSVKLNEFKPIDVDVRGVLKKFKAPDWKNDVEEIFENELFDLGIEDERYGSVDLGFDSFDIELELDSR